MSELRLCFSRFKPLLELLLSISSLPWFPVVVSSVSFDKRDSSLKICLKLQLSNWSRSRIFQRFAVLSRKIWYRSFHYRLFLKNIICSKIDRICLYSRVCWVTSSYFFTGNFRFFIKFSDFNEIFSACWVSCISVKIWISLKSDHRSSWNRSFMDSN